MKEIHVRCIARYAVLFLACVLMPLVAHAATCTSGTMTVVVTCSGTFAKQGTSGSQPLTVSISGPTSKSQTIYSYPQSVGGSTTCSFGGLAAGNYSASASTAYGPTTTGFTFSVSNIYDPSPVTYTLTVSAGPGGTASGSASGLSGSANPSISATPNSGYTFSGWSGSTVANSSATSTTVPMNNGNRSVTANFTAIPSSTYTLTVSAGTGGTASGSASGLSGSANPSISASPNSGYAFSSWSGSSVANSSATSTTVPMNNGNRSVTANFRRKYPPSASISASPTSITTSGSSSISFSASDSDSNLSRWRFYKSTNSNPQWSSASGGSASGSYSFSGSAGSHTFYVEVEDADGQTDSDSVTITVTDPPVTPTYTLTVSAGSGGTASGSASGLSGSASRSISASANSGYTFSHWSGSTVADSSSASTTIAMNNGDRSVTANFTSVSSTYTLTVNAGSGGTASGSASGLSGSATRSISASANSGYTFSHWSGSTVADSSSASTTITMNNGNRSVTANFTPVSSTYTLTVNAGTGGTASGSASGLSGSANPPISATPNSGYTFSGWSGSTVANSSATSTTVPMNNGNRSVTANFTPVASTYTLTVSAGTGGTASGSASGLSGSANPPITATPNAGYAFSGWSGDAVANASSTSTTVPMNNGNRSVTANFVVSAALAVAFDLPTEIVRPKTGSVSQPIAFSATSSFGRLTEYQWTASSSTGASLGSSSWTAFSTHTEQGAWVPRYYNDPYWSYDCKIDQAAMNAPYSTWYGVDVYAPDGTYFGNHWNWYIYSNWKLIRAGYWSEGYYESVTVPDRLSNGSVTKSISITPTTATGLLSVTFTVRDADGRTATLTKTTNVVNQLTPQTVTISPDSRTITAGQSITFTSTGAQTSYIWGGSASGTGAVQSVTFPSAGNFNVTVYAPADTNYAQSNMATASITVNPANYALTTYVAAGNGSVNPSGTNTYTANSDVTVQAIPGVNMRFSQWVGDASGSANPLILRMNSPKSVGAAFIAKVAQTITFPNPGDTVLVRAADGTYSAAVMLLANASSGLPVTYTLLSGSGVTLSGSMLTGTQATTVTVQADQAGDAVYSAAAPVSVTFNLVYPPTWDAASQSNSESNNSTTEFGTGHFIDPKP